KKHRKFTHPVLVLSYPDRGSKATAFGRHKLCRPNDLHIANRAKKKVILDSFRRALLPLDLPTNFSDRETTGPLVQLAQKLRFHERQLSHPRVHRDRDE